MGDSSCYLCILNCIEPNPFTIAQPVSLIVSRETAIISCLVQRSHPSTQLGVVYVDYQCSLHFCRRSIPKTVFCAITVVYTFWWNVIPVGVHMSQFVPFSDAWSIFMHVHHRKLQKGDMRMKLEYEIVSDMSEYLETYTDVSKRWLTPNEMIRVCACVI